MDKTKIEWSDATWQVTRGCARVSPGCGTNMGGCYAERMAYRLEHYLQQPKYEGTTRMTAHGPRWTGQLNLDFDALRIPLHWRSPRRIFVDSMSDLFHDAVPDEFIDRVFGVMTLARWHTFQVLTKRSSRLRSYMNNPETPSRVAKAADQIAVAEEIAAMGAERFMEVVGYPGYLVSDRGVVYTTRGSGVCAHCGNAVSGMARRMYCSKKCKQNAEYHRKVGRPSRFQTTSRPMTPDVGHAGHYRVSLRGPAGAQRELVHRLVLTAFVRPPVGDEQGCHRDGDPSNNALPNLRWGSQSDNWDDRKRHGNQRSHFKLAQDQVDQLRAFVANGGSAAEASTQFAISETQVRNIITGAQWTGSAVPWPPPSVWVGVSAEDQKCADERVLDLVQTNASVRFVSVEPMLGPVSLTTLPDGSWHDREGADRYDALRGSSWWSNGDHGLGGGPRIHWVVVGSESGPKPRAMQEEWVRSLRDQCAGTDVALFYKQKLDEKGRKVSLPLLDGVQHAAFPVESP